MSRLRFDTCGMVCDYLSMEKGVAVESNNFLMDFLYGKLVFLRYVKAQQSKFFSIILVITCGATFLRYGWKYKEEITRGFLWMQWYMKKANNLFIL